MRTNKKPIATIRQSCSDSLVTASQWIEFSGATRVGVPPAAKIHDFGRLSRRPGGFGRLHDIEPIAVEEERVFSEQVVELWNHGVVVGNGPGFELAQNALDLCGREFHCTLPSIGSLQGHEPRDIALCAASHLRWSNVKLGHP